MIRPCVELAFRVNQPARNFICGADVSFSNIALLVISSGLFIGAASAAKIWALSPDDRSWLVATLLLYTLGNLVVLKLIRDLGMGVALSLSSVLQLLAVNLVAIFFFREELSGIQTMGLFLAIAAIAMITLGADG